MSQKLQVHYIIYCYNQTISIKWFPEENLLKNASREKEQVKTSTSSYNNPFLNENYFKGRKNRVNVSLNEKYVELGHGFLKTSSASSTAPFSSGCFSIVIFFSVFLLLYTLIIHRAQQMSKEKKRRRGWEDKVKERDAAKEQLNAFIFSSNAQDAGYECTCLFFFHSIYFYASL